MKKRKQQYLKKNWLLCSEASDLQQLQKRVDELTKMVESKSATGELKSERDIQDQLDDLDARCKKMWDAMVEHKRILEENRTAIIALQKKQSTEQANATKLPETKKQPEKIEKVEKVPVVNNDLEVSKADNPTTETAAKATRENDKKVEKVNQEQQHNADKKKALEEAYALIKGVSKLDPEDPKRLGMYEKAANLAPEDKEIQGYYLYEICTSGKYKRTIREGREILKKFPDGDFIHLVIGYAEYNLGDFAAAEKDFQKSVELESKGLMGQYYLGRAMAQTNNPGAKAQLEKFIMMASEPSTSSEYAEYIKEAKATLNGLEGASDTNPE